MIVCVCAWRAVARSDYNCLPRQMLLCAFMCVSVSRECLCVNLHSCEPRVLVCLRILCRAFAYLVYLFWQSTQPPAAGHLFTAFPLLRVCIALVLLLSFWFWQFSMIFICTFFALSLRAYLQFSFLCHHLPTRQCLHLTILFFFHFFFGLKIFRFFHFLCGSCVSTSASEFLRGCRFLSAAALLFNLVQLSLAFKCALWLFKWGHSIFKCFGKKFWIVVDFFKKWWYNCFSIYWGLYLPVTRLAWWNWQTASASNQDIRSRKKR